MMHAYRFYKGITLFIGVRANYVKNLGEINFGNGLRIR